MTLLTGDDVEHRPEADGLQVRCRLVPAYVLCSQVRAGSIFRPLSSLPLDRSDENQ